MEFILLYMKTVRWAHYKPRSLQVWVTVVIGTRVVRQKHGVPQLLQSIQQCDLSLPHALLYKSTLPCAAGYSRTAPSVIVQDCVG